jgi:hypothetical protein
VLRVPVGGSASADSYKAGRVPEKEGVESKGKSRFVRMGIGRICLNLETDSAEWSSIPRNDAKSTNVD